MPKTIILIIIYLLMPLQLSAGSFAGRNQFEVKVKSGIGNFGTYMHFVQPGNVFRFDLDKVGDEGLVTNGIFNNPYPFKNLKIVKDEHSGNDKYYYRFIELRGPLFKNSPGVVIIIISMSASKQYIKNNKEIGIRERIDVVMYTVDKETLYLYDFLELENISEKSLTK